MRRTGMKAHKPLQIPLPARVISACVAAGLSLAACAGGNSSGAVRAAANSAATTGKGLAPLTAPADAARVPEAGHIAAPGKPVVLPVTAGSEIVYTAQLTVRARDVSDADARAKQIVADQGGYVASEESAIDPVHPDRSTATLVLKIPVGLYPATLDNLASALGTRVSLQQQAQDVTENVANVNSRVASAVAAIAQLRALLGRAGSIADLLSIQNQISQQESDLESLQAQQRALDHETAYATLSLRLVATPAPAKHKRHNGNPAFIRGLSAGWLALRGFAAGLLVVLGALIPFTALIAVAAYLAYRGRRLLPGRRTHT